MRCCTPHWEALKKAVVERGLWPLVKTGKALEESIAAEFSESRASEDFDPLLRATLMIYSEAVTLGGMYLMSRDENGKEYCPLCEADENVKPPAELKMKVSQHWIEGCTDAILALCQEQGRVPRVQ